MDGPSRPLPSGDALPSIGFGTWDIPDAEIPQAIEAALDAGYRHIDTAEGYKNEAAIGEAIAGVDRADLFLTSKVLPKHLAYESVIEACHGSLERLGTDYLDLYLIHWPNPAISLRETLAAMAHLHAEGLVRNIGVSNFSAYQLSCAHRVTDVPIAVNQIEYHPWWRQDAVVEYCAETDTVVEAAAPLARGAVFGEPTITEVAERTGRSAASVVLAWALENDVVVLPKSTDPEHIAANHRVRSEPLSPEDHAAVEAIAQREPVYDHPARVWTDADYGISP
ncbi:MAG: aldo/keto reductase [Haloferacaceae archaeon]|jgi:diketogulonate reductase-like aldo/keto reductase|nr:aldo/keto reductase [Haloferacaceae archaeon]